MRPSHRVRAAVAVAAMAGVALSASAALPFSTQEQEVPYVDPAVIWIGTVERGDVMRQVRGPGTMERFGDGYHAHMRIAEINVGDVRLDQVAEIDTRRGIVTGKVAHIEDRVDQGTVKIILEITDEIPDNVRPGLSIDARINVQNFEDVLYVQRPAYAQPGQKVGIFKLSGDETTADRVPVTWAESSVDVIMVADGLVVGDKIILSDMSRFDTAPRVRLEQ